MKSFTKLVGFAIVAVLVCVLVFGVLSPAHPWLRAFLTGIVALSFVLAWVAFEILEGLWHMMKAVLNYWRGFRG